MLMVAAKCGHEKAVSLLLNKKIDINSQNVWIKRQFVNSVEPRRHCHPLSAFIWTSPHC